MVSDLQNQLRPNPPPTGVRHHCQIYHTYAKEHSNAKCSFAVCITTNIYIFLLLEDLIILHPLRMNDFLASAEAANCKVRPATQVMASCNALLCIHLNYLLLP
jgi:hypothetical protein